MATGPSNLTGLFKEAYGPDVNNLIPESAKITKMVNFVPRDKETGNLYHQPVIVSNEHGVTYATVDAGAFALNTAISMQMKDAQIAGAQILLRSSLSYDAASRASNNVKAFMKATELMVQNMMESGTDRLETACLYGASGLATCSSSVNTNATTTVVQISTASWATGIWLGKETCKIQFYNGSSLISSSTDSIFTISVVDVANRKLTVTGTATGITALDADLAGAGAGVTKIFFNGAKGNEMSGLDTIITNTGQLFNVDAAAYNLWKGNTYSAASAALTMGKILSAASLAVQRGLNEKATVFMNPDTWTNVASDLAALRKFDGSYRREKAENGVESISFYHQNGELELVGWNKVKEGEAFIIPMKRVRRLGSTDFTFKTPGREDEIFLHLADNAGYELRLYTDQAIFLETPARATKITGIVNS